MDVDTSQWVKRAEMHLSSARGLLDLGNYLDVYFHCQQALELLLRAIYSERHRELAPRLHSLPALAEAVPIEIPSNYGKLIRRLTELYIETR